MKWKFDKRNNRTQDVSKVQYSHDGAKNKMKLKTEVVTKMNCAQRVKSE